MTGRLLPNEPGRGVPRNDVFILRDDKFYVLDGREFLHVAISATGSAKDTTSCAKDATGLWNGGNWIYFGKI